MEHEFQAEPGSAETIFAAWALRVEAGEALELDELLRDHPEEAEELRRFHDDWKLFAPLLGRAVPGLIAGDTGIVIAPLSADADEDGEEPSPELLKRLGLFAPSLGRYRFRAVIGRGGGGVVLKVWDTKLHRPLAMKVVLGRGEDRPSGDTPKIDGRTLSRFVDEARIASQLSHPGIVPVHELGADESGRAFFTMKLVKGEDLARIFEHVKTGHDGWNQTRALNVLLRVCESVAFAHEKGVIHRDLKPANVMVGRHGEVYVMDWGLARVLGEEDRKDVRVRPPAGSSALLSVRQIPHGDIPDTPLYTMDGDVVGTPAYMPPEQAAGDLARMGSHSDVYAIGAMLYHLLAGHMPYVPPGGRANNYAIWQRVQEGPPAPIFSRAPQATAELVAICEKAMDRDPYRRYPDIPPLSQDLRAFLEGRVVVAHRTGPWAEIRKWVKRNRALAVSMAGAVLVAVISAIVFAQERFRSLAIAARAATTAAQAQHEALRHTEARRSSYVTAVSAASMARKERDPAMVRRFLDSAPMELRNWEWGYLDAASDESILTLPGCNALFSPDSKQVVTVIGNRNHIACIHDFDSGSRAFQLEGHHDLICDLAFSQDGEAIVTTSADGTARLWSARTGYELMRLEGHNSIVYSGRFSSDGAHIVTASYDGTVRIWAASSGAEILRLSGFKGAVRAAAFGFDDTRVLSMSSDGEISVWRTDDGAEMLRFAGHAARVDTVPWSQNALRVATIVEEGILQVWDTNDGAALARLEGHVGRGQIAAFTADGTRLLAVLADNSLRVLEADTGSLVSQIEKQSGAVLSAEFSPDGSVIVTISDDRVVRTWDAQTGLERARLAGHIEAVRTMAFSSDGAYFISSSDDGTSRVWETQSRTEPAFIDGDRVGICSATFSPDGEYIVTGCDDGAVRVWDAVTRLEVARLGGHTAPVRCTTFNPAGTKIVSTSDDETARVWDAESGAQVGQRLGHAAAVRTAAWDPSGTRIVTASDDGMAQVWSVQTGSEVIRLVGHTDWIRCVGFDASGTRVATASDDGTARVWDARTGTQIVTLGGHGGWVMTLNFSPTGNHIVTGSQDGTARVWNASTGVEMLRLMDSMSCVNHATYHPDGSRIFTASDDGIVRAWDADSGKEIIRFVGHGASVVSAETSPDGSRLVTASFDRTVRVWSTDLGAELVRLDGQGCRIDRAVFSADGVRLLAVLGDSRGALLWDSVCRRERIDRGSARRSDAESTKFSAWGVGSISEPVERAHAKSEAK